MGLTRNQVVIVAILLAGATLVVLNQTLLSPAYPSIMADLQADATTVQWLTSAYSLVEAIVIPLSAFLIGRFPTRKLFIAGVSVFALGSLMAAFSPFFGILLLGRIFQAAATGVVMPMVFTVILLIFPREKRGSAMGIVSLVIGFAPAVGPSLSGLLVESVGWRSLFMLVTALAVLIVILAIVFIRKLFVRPADMPEPDAEHRKNVFIASYHLTNPAVFGKSVHEIAAQSHHHFVISRVWREGQVSIPTSDKTLQKDDVILVITTPGEADALRLIFGEQEQKDWNTENIDWNAVDSQLTSQRILVTRPEINGKKLSSLRLRNNYGINISRVYRSGVQLLATPDLRLQMGDRLTVVGEAAAIKHVEKILGNAVKNLEEPNLVAVFVGLILGLTLGSIPVSIPGISLPVKLGLAGGPIIVGILIGTFGPRLHMITYTTYSANLMLRALGLSMYLACLGLEAGTHFFETVMRPEGALWLLLGFLLTFVPVVLLGIFALRILRIDFGSVAGMLCGSMANPMALNYANDTIEGDNPSVSYATVYPLCMFLRVIIIQVMLMIFL